MRVNKERVKQAARGTWDSILPALTNIPESVLDGKNHPCPQCGGKDRFRFIDAEEGAVLCNQCFREKNGDGLAAIAWARGCDFTEALRLLAAHLGFEVEPQQARRRQSRRQEREFGLDFVDWNEKQIESWCARKRGITPEAVRAAGGRIANSYDPDGQKRRVVALPVYGPRGKLPVGYVTYSITGGELVTQASPVKQKTRPGTKKGWIGDYELQDLSAAEVVWKTEGPTDALALRAAIPEAERPRHLALSNVHGATETPQKEVVEQLRGKHVVVVADPDDAGRQGAQEKWGPACARVARECRVIAPPGGEQDLRDWLASGGTFGALLEHARASPVLDPPPEGEAPIDETPSRDPDDDRGTDLRNAERLVEWFGAFLRWVSEWNCWIVWNGRRWRHDRDGQVWRWGGAVAHRLRQESLQAGGDEEDARRALRDAHALERRGRLESMIFLARHQIGVTVGQEELDADPYLLGLRAGYVDLRTGAGHEPDRERLCIRAAGADRLDPEAECPRWERFLREVMCGDEELVGYLQRYCGYCLTGDTRERSFSVFCGSGRNGKSVFLDVLEAVLGEYACKTPVETLLAGRESRGPSDDIARLSGRRLVYAAESQEGARLHEGRVKELTGREKIAARYSYGSFFEFEPQFKLVLITNHQPQIRDTSDSIWDRVHCVPFRARFEGKSEDKDLRGKLLEELPGILRWAVEGALWWQREGLAPPSAVRAAVDEYRSEEDLLGQWIQSHCILGPTVSAAARDLYRSFRSWAEEQGSRPLSQNRFSRSLKERGFRRSKVSGGRRVWIGIGLRVDNSQEEFGGNAPHAPHAPHPRSHSQEEFGGNAPHAPHAPHRGSDGVAHVAHLTPSAEHRARQASEGVDGDHLGESSADGVKCATSATPPSDRPPNTPGPQTESGRKPGERWVDEDGVEWEVL